MGTLHEDQYKFLIISRSIVLGIRNASENVEENKKTHILCSITFFSPKIVPFVRKCGILL